MADSYMNSILAKDGPLSKQERDALHDWRAVIEADCSAFGETAADADRLRLINKRLSEDPSNG